MWVLGQAKLSLILPLPSMPPGVENCSISMSLSCNVQIIAVA